MRMFSASILFVWDLDNPEPHGRTSLIDMAHVHDLKDGETDENVFKGMESLITMLEGML